MLFGAAYSGALAAWHRTAHPDQSVGAVVSSPLISLELNNYQYELNLARTLIDSSYQCYLSLIFSARAIREELQYVDGVRRLNTQIGFAPNITEAGLDYKTAEYLHFMLVPVFQLPVQYNRVNIGPFGTDVGVPELCALMSNETIRPVKRIYQWINQVR